MPDPAGTLARYPFQLSGGQQQRVVIAMALAGDPRLLVLDEPTTGLDATVEAEVLDLIEELRGRINAAILLISHNLGLVARLCERVGVMYAGRIVEEGAARDALHRPAPPLHDGPAALRAALRRAQGRGLAGADPRLGAAAGHHHAGLRLRLALRARAAGLHAARARPVPGVRRGGRGGGGREAAAEAAASRPGRALAARRRAGRSRGAALALLLRGAGARHAGLGRARAARAGAVGGRGRSPARRPRAQGLPRRAAQAGGRRRRDHRGRRRRDVRPRRRVRQRQDDAGRTASPAWSPPTAARCASSARRCRALAGDRDRDMLRAIQMVFQNPDSTLNPSWSTRAHPRAAPCCASAGSRATSRRDASRSWRARSTSSRATSRTGPASSRAGRSSASPSRAPSPGSRRSSSATSRPRRSTSPCRPPSSTCSPTCRPSRACRYIFISHDLAVVRYLADRIGVMYLAWLVEIGAAEQVFTPPQHPYTEALVSAIPTLDFEHPSPRITLRGPIPSLSEPPSGCRFHTRCHRFLGDVCVERGAAVARCRRGPPLPLPHPAGRAARAAAASRSSPLRGRAARCRERS